MTKTIKIELTEKQLLLLSDLQALVDIDYDKTLHAGTFGTIDDKRGSLFAQVWPNRGHMIVRYLPRTTALKVQEIIKQESEQ